jgi:hypothetical protein
MRVGGISETWSNIGDDIIFTLMFKKCGVKCHCVIAGNVFQILFYFMSIGDFVLHAELYEAVLG